MSGARPGMRVVGGVAISEAAAFAGCLVCPQCGDSKFGSSPAADGGLSRHCHGHLNDEQVCTFTWPATDDHLYFHLPLRFVLGAVGEI